MLIERTSLGSRSGVSRRLTLSFARGVIAHMMLVPLLLGLGWHERPFGIADGLLRAALGVM